MNKKIISFVTAFFMMFSLFDIPAAYADYVNGCTIDGDTLTSYSGGSNAVVPDGVKHIAYIAFVNDLKVTSVTLPEGIETIGIDAFCGCSNMTSINLPDSITSIGESAFALCNALTGEIKIPAGVTVIEPFVFDNCEALQNIIIHSNVESIGEYSFRQCRGLTSLHIPDSVKSIGKNAFIGCDNLQTVNIPNGVETIEEGTFMWCRKLSSIEIPDSVEKIGQNSFSGCDNLKKVFYPDTAETKWAFPTNADRIAYRTNADGSVTVTNIEPAGGSRAAEIPDTINGLPVASVDKSVRDKVSESGHTHKLTKTDGKEPTCTVDGNVEYWTCSLCGRYFSDESGATVITDTVIPAAHTLEHKAATESTCTENGNIEYWACSVCGKIFPDENAVNEINETDTVSPALGHDYSEKWSGNDDKHWHKCTRCESTSDEDSHTGSASCEDKAVCEICGQEYGEPLGHSYVGGICERCQAIDPDHTHRGGTATCTQKAVCTVCNQEYGELGQHSFRNGICTVCKASDPNYTQPTESIVTDPTVSDTTTDTSSETSSDTSSDISSETEPAFSDTSTDTSSETSSDTGSDVTVPTVTEPTVTVTVPSVTDPIATEPTYTYTVPTFTQPPATYPTYTPPAPAPAVTEAAVKSDREQPFIQGDKGKSGWDAISDIISNTPDGGTVTVDMNNSAMLPKDIVSQIKGRDIDLVLVMKNKFVWTINGTSVTNAKTVNMKVQRSVNISASTVEEYFGDLETVQIRLAHNGDFGFTAELSVSLGSRYNGMTAGSYCYKAGKFSFGDNAEIAEGTAKLRFSHASNWLIAITDTAAEDVSADAAISAKGDPVGSCRSVSLLFLTVIPIIGTAFICIKRSRQK